MAIKPGKPLLVATRDCEGGTQIVVGLPGNPVSSFVTAFLFALPMLRAASGAARPAPRPFTTRLGGPLRAIGNRREFVRGHWDGETVVPLEVQDSGALAALAASNVLIDRQLSPLPPPLVTRSAPTGSEMVETLDAFSFVAYLFHIRSLIRPREAGESC